VAKPQLFLLQAVVEAGEKRKKLPNELIKTLSELF